MDRDNNEIQVVHLDQQHIPHSCEEIPVPQVDPPPQYATAQHVDLPPPCETAQHVDLPPPFEAAQHVDLPPPYETFQHVQKDNEVRLMQVVELVSNLQTKDRLHIIWYACVSCTLVYC